MKILERNLGRLTPYPRFGQTYYDLHFMISALAQKLGTLPMFWPLGAGWRIRASVTEKVQNEHHK